MLKYLKFQLTCDIAFGVFMVVWFVSRHVLYLMIIVSIFQHVPGEVKYGCYSGGGKHVKGPFKLENERDYLFEPFRNPTGIICFNDSYKWGFVYTLLTLQAILWLWFAMIVRVAVKVLKGGGADDSRSDDEDEDEDEQDEKIEQKPIRKSERQKNARPYEEEVGAGEITYNRQRTSPARRFRKGGGVSSGVTLQSDRKELLGRIGCDGGHD